MLWYSAYCALQLFVEFDDIFFYRFLKISSAITKILWKITANGTFAIF